MFAKLVLSFLFVWLAYRYFKLFLNYLEARRFGLPIIVLPLTWQDPLWSLLYEQCSFLERLPFTGWYKYSNLVWSLMDRYDTHERLGGAFTIVQPGYNQLIIADNNNIKDVLTKYKKWQRPNKEMYETFDIYGTNIASANGEDWQRHRKIMNNAFTEKTMSRVWEAAKKQSRQWLIRIEQEQDPLDLVQIRTGCEAISANVLMYAIFGLDLDFDRSEFTKVQQGHKNSFHECLLFMSKNIIAAFALKRLKPPKWLEFPALRKVRDNEADLQLYLEEMVNSPTSEFLQVLVDANIAEKSGGRSSLKDQEIIGNLFIMQLGGFDTITYTLCQTLGLLATHPVWQVWARESPSIDTYDTDFEGSSVRLRAIMLETLRLYNVAVAFPRASLHTEVMTINNKEVIIPANTWVSINHPGQGANPSIWGEDAKEWRPDRWVVIEGGTEKINKTLEKDLISWSSGPRICPGKKFSQIEFVAIMSEVLMRYELQGSPNLKDELEEFVMVMTPKIKRPEKVWIKFVAR